MSNSSNLHSQIKKMMVENCMLKISAEEIGDDQLLFGPDSLGLDSIDALQLVVALEKEFQLKFSDPEAARNTMKSVKTIVAAIQEHQATSN